MTQAAPGATAPAPIQGVALVAGRIDYMRTFKNRDGSRTVATLIKLPAPDEFTGPQTVEVRSSAKLGEVGELWRGKVRIGGYGRAYKVTDQETGEQRPVRTAEVTLTVEA